MAQLAALLACLWGSGFGAAAARVDAESEVNGVRPGMVPAALPDAARWKVQTREAGVTIYVREGDRLSWQGAPVDGIFYATGEAAIDTILIRASGPSCPALRKALDARWGAADSIVADAWVHWRGRRADVALDARTKGSCVVEISTPESIEPLPIVSGYPWWRAHRAEGILEGSLHFVRVVAEAGGGHADMILGDQAFRVPLVPVTCSPAEQCWRLTDEPKSSRLRLSRGPNGEVLTLQRDSDFGRFELERVDDPQQLRQLDASFTR